MYVAYAIRILGFGHYAIIDYSLPKRPRQVLVDLGCGLVTKKTASGIG